MTDLRPPDESGERRAEEEEADGPRRRAMLVGESQMEVSLCCSGTAASLTVCALALPSAGRRRKSCRISRTTRQLVRRASDTRGSHNQACANVKSDESRIQDGARITLDMYTIALAGDPDKLPPSRCAGSSSRDHPYDNRVHGNTESTRLRCIDKSSPAQPTDSSMQYRWPASIMLSNLWLQAGTAA